MTPIVLQLLNLHSQEEERGKNTEGDDLTYNVGYRYSILKELNKISVSNKDTGNKHPSAQTQKEYRSWSIAVPFCAALHQSTRFLEPKRAHFV